MLELIATVEMPKGRKARRAGLRLVGWTIYAGASALVVDALYHAGRIQGWMPDVVGFIVGGR